MPTDARRLAAVVDAPEPLGRGNFAFRKDLAAQTKALFESLGAPLAGMSDAPFADLLRTIAAFPTYSLGNQSLIAMQASGATSLSSAERWASFDRRLVLNARAVYIWAPADNRSQAGSANGFARPTLDRAEKIAHSLGLRATQSGDYLFDEHAIRENPLWGGSQTWRSIRAVRINDGGDHIAVKLITRDGRSLDRRARTAIGLVKALMQAGTSPNDETITAYLARLDGDQEAQLAPRTRDFFQRFKLVPVYEVGDTDGPELPEPATIDHAVALQNLITYLGTQKVTVIVGDHGFRAGITGESAEIYLNERAEKDTQLSQLLDATADFFLFRRADQQGRDLLPVERHALRYVFDAHFGFRSIAPELGYGLAPNVEPHAAAEVVKARLSSIHDIAKEIILAAQPGYENALLKAITQARAPAPASQTDVAPTPAFFEGPKPTAVVNKLEAPKTKAKKPKPAEGAVESQIVEAPTAVAPVDLNAASIVDAVEDFNPFAEVGVKDEAEDFNPFAEGPAP